LEFFRVSRRPGGERFVQVLEEKKAVRKSLSRGTIRGEEKKKERRPHLGEEWRQFIFV